MVFRKNLRSLERRWEKISKFLGDLPSEQIFYRNIPLGAPDKCYFVLISFLSIRVIHIKTICHHILKEIT